eukprot:TRINITY_DN5337_c0_g1_i2.p1 TRINITY_DN5337_c0_g1~~TRINITY_DN5337_c0_g1_i2.p1  ORF type:complete len:206 (-),score=59.83 TRINITY_DN5337_c0_g1_i2:141-758(-)
MCTVLASVSTSAGVSGGSGASSGSGGGGSAGGSRGGDTGGSSGGCEGLQHLFHPQEEFKESREENLRLKEKNHLLVELVACSICYTSNANCVLSPCGHSLCCFCFIQISKNWAKQIRFSHFSSTVGQGPCPFCRAIIMEVFQTKSHDVITFNVDSDDDTGGGGGGGCGGGGGGDGDNDDVDDVDGFDSSDGWQLMVIMMVLEDGW